MVLNYLFFLKIITIATGYYLMHSNYTKLLALALIIFFCLHLFYH